MPRLIRDPSGGMHEFPDDATNDQINAQMEDYWARRSAPPPNTPAPSSPPGTQPGNFQPNPYAPPAGVVPLSPTAERSRRMIMFGDKDERAAGESLLNTDPTFMNQKATATKMADLQYDWARRQDAGRQILPALERFRGMINTYSAQNPEAYAAATGAYNSRIQRAFNEIKSPAALMAPDMTPTEARAAYPGILPAWAGGNDPGSELNKKSWEIQNDLVHTADALVADVMAAAGPQVAGSDARMHQMRDLIYRAIQAPTAEAANHVLNSANAALREVFRLPRLIRNRAEYEALLIPPDADYVDYETPDGQIRRKSRVAARGVQ